MNEDSKKILAVIAGAVRSGTANVDEALATAHSLGKFDGQMELSQTLVKAMGKPFDKVAA